MDGVDREKVTAMTEHRYQQVAEELRREIETGKIGYGTPLPSEVELREQYDTSRNTIRDAVKLLITQGHVESRKGQGWFAARRRNSPLPIVLPVDQQDGLVGIEGRAELAAIERQGRHLSASRLEVRVHPAPEDTAELLQISTSSSVITRSERLTVDGRPWLLRTTAYYPRELAASAPALLIDEDISGGALAYIERETGIREVGHHDLVTGRLANPEEAAFFQVPDGTQAAVTVVIRTGYQAANLAPLRVSTTVYRADAVQFAVDSGLVPHRQRLTASAPNPGIDLG